VQRVLVCDDELHIVRLIKVNLERQGRQVVTAGSGKEALSKLFSEPFDMAAIDADLPDMTGREVVATIRANPATAHIRIVLLGEKEDRDDDDPPGPDGYLTKPFNPDQLLGW